MNCGTKLKVNYFKENLKKIEKEVSRESNIERWLDSMNPT